MFIRFEIDNDKNISISDYMYKPITNDNKAIGIIINAFPNENNIILEAEIFNNFVDINVQKRNSDNKVNCTNINLNLEEKPFYIKGNYSFISNELKERLQETWRDNI